MRGIRGESGPRGKVLLIAYDQGDAVVLEASLSVVDYYDELHPMIDSNDFRRQHSVRRIHGKIFDLDGALDQEFDNSYGPDGLYAHGRAVHADGTVIED